MKNLKKTSLKLDKEVITSLSDMDLFHVKGGASEIGVCPTVTCVSGFPYDNKGCNVETLPPNHCAVHPLSEDTHCYNPTGNCVTVIPLSRDENEKTCRYSAQTDCPPATVVG